MYHEKLTYETLPIPKLDDDFADNKIIVTLKKEYSSVNNSFKIDDFEISDGTNIESIKDLTYMTNPSKIVNREGFVQILSIELKENCKGNVLKAIEELEKLDMVLAAEPDYNIIAEDDLWLPSSNQPNDTHFSQQWGLGAAPGAQIVGAGGAWSISTEQSDPRVKVGIFETGVQEDHPDLRVIPGNMMSGVANHGTHVAGIIGAITNNNEGVSGIAQVELALLDRGNGGALTSNPDNTGVFPNSLTWAINNDIRIVILLRDKHDKKFDERNCA